VIVPSFWPKVNTDDLYVPTYEELYLVIDRQILTTMYDFVYETWVKNLFMKEKEVMPWFVGLAKGLDEIHTAGLAHRNISSKTVFFGENKDIPKLGALG
jgi:serine/threonine protein kinase